MQPTQLEIEKIKPDKNQPRKIFSKAHIEGLTESIKTEGIINPIEIDENNKIITGECRFRAAKLAGLKKVPVQLNTKEMTDYERLRRQIAENVHQSGSQEEAMNPIDTAMGYKTLLTMMGWSPSPASGLRRDTIGKFVGDDYVKELSKEIGVARSTIYEYLKLLDQPDFVIEKIREGDAMSSYAEADRAPKQHQMTLKKEIAEGELKGKYAIRTKIDQIKKLPELAEINLLDNVEEISEETRRIVRCVTQLGLALQDTPLGKLSPYQQRRVAENLSWLMKKIMEYVGAQKKELEIKN